MSQTEPQSLQSSRKRFSLRKPFRIISEKKQSILIKRKEKKNQKRDVEKSITLGEVYLIVYLFSIEITKRGLTEPGIFNPVRLGDINYEARYLVNCLLRENRKEFEEELKIQSIHNFAVGIRIALRNCPSNLVSYEYYEEFVKYEQEWDYDPKSESFTKFLSYLPQKNKGILVELFDLFALIMENSHVNLMHPTRILRSMSLHIFNESKTLKTCKKFRQAYQNWLKYSNALMHLFLAYIRERAYTAGLPERLNLLLIDYVECRKRCLINSGVSEDGNDVIFSEHILPDITIADLNEAITSRQIFNRKDINKSTRRSIFERFPEIVGSVSASQCKEFLKYYSHIFDGPRNPEKKWDKLQTKGLDVLSEEALVLFLTFDDKRMNLDVSIEDSVCSDNSATIYDNELTDDGSNIFSRTSTLDPYSDFCEENSATKKSNKTSNEKREQKTRKFGLSSFLCFKRRPRSVKSEPESSHLCVETINALFPYAWVEIIKEGRGENLNEWIFIEPRCDLQVHECEWIVIEDKNQFSSNRKQVSNNTTFNSNGFSEFSQFNCDDDIEIIEEPQHRPQIHKQISRSQIQSQNSRLLKQCSKASLNSVEKQYRRSSTNFNCDDDMEQIIEPQHRPQIHKQISRSQIQSQNSRLLKQCSKASLNSMEKQYRRSSTNSSIFNRNIVRGKDLPFPTTSQRVSIRQMSRSQSPLSDIEVLIPVNQQCQNSHESYQRQSRQYSQQYLQLWDTQTTTIQIQNSRRVQVPKVTTQYVSTTQQQGQEGQERQKGQEGQESQEGEEAERIRELVELYPLLYNYI